MSVPSEAEPTLSICVPSIGRTQFLPAVRAAISAQTMQDFEVLVLDNACGPEARAFFADWEAADERVRVLAVDERVPMFANFDRGVFAAKGKYVTFFHDDDVYRHDFAERAVFAMEAAPQVGICGSNFDFIDEHGAQTGTRAWIARDEVWAGRRYIQTLLTRGKNIVPMSGLVFRREVFSIHGFDIGVSMHWGDLSVLMRYSEDWDMALLAEPLMAIRRHQDQASVNTDALAGYTLRTELMNLYLDGYMQRHPQEHVFVADMRRAVARTERNHTALTRILHWTQSMSPKGAEVFLQTARNLSQRLGF